MSAVTLVINGSVVSDEIEPRTHLADFLREQRHLTGTHLGCEHGVCGACTVLIDGVPARSCIAYAVACEGAEITTVEGLDTDEIVSELRVAFTREHALQCGYCTPGMLISARDLVLRLADDDEARVRNAMSGNLCRCTGYVGIVRAIRSVIADRRARGIPALRGGGRSDVGPAGSGHGQATPASDTSASRPADVTVGPPPSPVPQALAADWTPSATFQRAFVIAHPRDRVWAFFGDIEAVAACLPGVALDGAPRDDAVSGHMRIGLGPISAAFRGQARIAREPADYSGVIEGSGQDARSQSATRGRIAYRLAVEDNETATRVDLVIGFALTGMLAQFGRSGLVQSVMDRIIADFVRNLSARLNGDPPAAMTQAPRGELSVAALFLAMAKDVGERLRNRLFGSGPR